MRIGLSRSKIAIVTGSLVIELLIPILWIFLGTVLPTIPAVASVFVCCFAITGLLPLAALLTLILVPRLGRYLSIASLSWAGFLAVLLVVEELIRVAITDYPDPLEFTAALVMTATFVFALCSIQVVWLYRASTILISTNPHIS